MKINSVNERSVPDRSHPDTILEVDHSPTIRTQIKELMPKCGRILIVDDSYTTRKMLARRLRQQGHSVAQAQNGRQALEMVSSEPFDLVLLDVIMPEMDGYQVLQRLKDHKEWRDIPVIMISAVDEMSSVVRCIELGAEDYLPKTFDPVLLKARINACLEKKRLRDSEIEQQRKLNQLNRALQTRNRFIRETFGRYLSSEIVESLLETPTGLKLGGEKRILTILMADLRGFTSMSERLPPQDVVSIINFYLETMTEVIFRYKGTIDEFIGDAILAIFGAPIQREDDALRAVACAVEMQRAMASVNEHCRQAGFPEIAMGIGINTGEVVVGNIGGKQRTKYGVVGLNVNLTSRIESYTVGKQILISETTLEACGPILRIDSRAEVMPKGVSRPILIYEVGGIAGDYDLYLPPKQNLPMTRVSKPHPAQCFAPDGMSSRKE